MLKALPSSAPSASTAAKVNFPEFIELRHGAILSSANVPLPMTEAVSANAMNAEAQKSKEANLFITL
jgi:hypothetical protein